MKKKITIAHLYYDLMNLYGENGNIKALEKFIARQGVEVEVIKLTLGDRIDFERYDFYYIGSGSERNETLVMGDLVKYKKDIKKAIDARKFFLVTGNAMEMFGQRKVLNDGVAIECLGIFDYESLDMNYRLLGEITYEFDKLEKDKGYHIVGFKNCYCAINDNQYERPFQMPDNIKVNNFWAMTFFGPVLIRNPYFTDYLLSGLFESLDMEYEANDESCEYVAYHEYVKNFVENEK